MDKSIVKVTRERWEQAQQWERQHWLGDQQARSNPIKTAVWKLLSLAGGRFRYRGDDSNRWWQDQFEHYRFLPATVTNAIELGCGPFTNMRLISQVCRPAHLYLSDPLIKTYLRFRDTFPVECHRTLNAFMDDHPVEECPFAADYFDLTVMINVLDHVQDAERCLQTAIRITRPGGIFIFGQDLVDERVWELIRARPDNTGHPIKIEAAWIERQLAGRLTPVFQKRLTREQGRNPEGNAGVFLLAGRKDAASA